MSLGLAIQEQALAIGFDLVGIAPLSVWRDLEFSRRWVARGYGGEMRYLQNPKRADPRQVLPSAKSVICVGLIYNAPLPYSTEVSRPGSVVGSQLKKPEDKEQRTMDHGRMDESPRAWISRYAWGEDYHRPMREKLERLRAAVEALAPAVATRVYVDTGPIVERAFARYSGIGWMGKNTCLINEEKGSWFFLGVMLTSLELEPVLPAPDRCGSCTRCLEACPTGALVEPYVMDASRCIAYFTIELKGSIPKEFRPAIGANVFGCDICQDVCPWNSKSSRQLQDTGDQPSVLGHPQAKAERGAGHHARQAATTDVPAFQPLQVDLAHGTRHATPAFSLFNPPLEGLASLSEKDFRRVFAHSPVKRAKYRGWLRNLCVAMGNSSDPQFLPWLERAREDSDPVIREHAEWALGRLRRL
jgi:epoxyqueuosine reductase